MAISRCHFEFLERLSQRCSIPRGGALLEIGQAEIYGECDPRELLPDNEEVLSALEDHDPFRIGREVYRLFCEPKYVQSVDLGGKDSLRLDLNKPFSYLGRNFEVIVNHGTAEHIFNIGNVFERMHNHCEFNGLMIHEAPWIGWIDHGFYNLQPTLFYDLAAANNYRIELIAAGNLQAGTLRVFESRLDAVRFGKAADGDYVLFVAFRKAFGINFRMPMQEIYSNNVSEAIKQEWLCRA